MIDTIDDLIAAIEAGGWETRSNGAGWMASCSIHEDCTPSVSISEGENGKILLHCHGCGAGYEELLAGYGIDPGDMPGAGVGGGVTIEAYAAYVGLDVSFLLEAFEARRSTRQGKPSVRLPYRDVEGQPAGHRIRASLRGNPRLTEPKTVTTPYGAWRLPAITRTEVVLVEGESDVHVGWHAGLPVIGIPGATRWRPEWAELFGDFLRIVAWREPGEGGQKLIAGLAEPFSSRLLVVDPPAGVKDLRELWLGCGGDRGEMRRRWEAIRATARAWTDLEAERLEAERATAWAAAGEIACADRILDKVAETAEKLGLAGEATAVKLSYLVLVSALMDEPLAAAMRATAAAGKSQIVKTAARLVQDEAVIVMTAMSPRALAYTEEDLRHRTLLLIEADAIAGEEHETAALMLRTLVSEHVIEYRSVAEGKEVHRRVDGPLALLTTTTRASLEPQLETRILSIPADDSRDQTAKVIAAVFGAERLEDVDLAPFHALYRWLEAGARSVTVPYGATLAGLIKPVAVRLRRDARQLRDLIWVHAILHQASRERDDRGRVIATVDDYAAVRDLVAEPIAESAGATVHQTVRETVEKVAELTAGEKDASKDAGITLRRLGEALEIGVEAARSRVRRAGPFLRNLEDRPRQPGRYVVGEEVPTTADANVLPTVEALKNALDEAGKSQASPRADDRSDSSGENPVDTGDLVRSWPDDRTMTEVSTVTLRSDPHDRTQNPITTGDLETTVTTVTEGLGPSRKSTRNGALSLDENDGDALNGRPTSEAADPLDALVAVILKSLSDRDGS